LSCGIITLLLIPNWIQLDFIYSRRSEARIYGSRHTPSSPTDTRSMGWRKGGIFTPPWRLRSFWQRLSTAAATQLKEATSQSSTRTIDWLLLEGSILYAQAPRVHSTVSTQSNRNTSRISALSDPLPILQCWPNRDMQERAYRSRWINRWRFYPSSGPDSTTQLQDPEGHPSKSWAMGAATWITIRTSKVRARTLHFCKSFKVIYKIKSFCISFVN